MPFEVSKSHDQIGLRGPLEKQKPKFLKNSVEAKQFYDEYRASSEAEKAAKSGKMSGMNGLLGNTAEEQVDFGMKIFLASLKNQIPGNETNTDEMVRTLMQMTSTIQQARSNQLLEKGNAINSSIYATGLTRFEGDTVEHSGNIFTFDGDPQEMFCSFAPTATETYLQIFDAHAAPGSKPIQTLVVDPRGGLVTWDGKDAKGNDAPKADYKVFLVALNKDGKQVEAKLSLNSKVTSTYYDKDHRPVLKSGNIEIREIIGHKRKRHHPYEVAPRPMMRSEATNTASIGGDGEVLDYVI